MNININKANNATDTLVKNFSVGEQIRYVIAKGIGSDKATAELEKAFTANINKASIAPATSTNSNLVYPSQAVGVTSLVPVVTRSLIAMLVMLGAPTLPPKVRALTQAALLAASEIAEGAPYPAAAPGADFVLNDERKFGLILAFNNTLLAVGGDAVVSFVQANLENAVNNALDAAFVTSMTAAAGTAHTSIKDAFAAFAGDLRTAAWIGNPETLGGLRSASETQVGPQGGSFYQLPALPVLAMPNGALMLVDAKRTAVYDGALTVESTTEADIIMDTDPANSSATPLRTFQQHVTAMKVTKYADYRLMVPPVATAV